MEEYDQFIYDFYNSVYLRNRYPSPAYAPNQGPFKDGDSPDLAAVALGFKKSAIIPVNDLKRNINDAYLMTCLYAGKTISYIDSRDIAIVCDVKDKNQLIDAIEQFNHFKIGLLLDYPKHLVYIYTECTAENQIPNWKEYNQKAEAFARKL